MTTISWWVPRRSYARRHIRGHRAILREISLARILLAGLAVAGVLCAGLRAAYPALDLRPLWMMLPAIPALFALIAFNTLVVPVLIPPTVTIEGETIRYAHEGGSRWAARFADCRAFRLVLLPAGIRRLRFRHDGRRRAVGLAAKVDLESLRDRLPRPVRVIDARGRAGLSGPRRNRHETT